MDVSESLVATWLFGFVKPEGIPSRQGFGGGIAGGSFLVAEGAGSRLTDVRGGKEGVLGGGGRLSVVVLCVEAFLVPNGVRALPVSVVGVLFGGSGGSIEASKAGAIILPPSIEDILAAWLVPPFDRLDIEETVEKVEEIDWEESRLFIWFDGRLGGNAGDG